jgi:hypothetical protein
VTAPAEPALASVRRWIAGVALAGLAVITGIISYLHALTVAEWTGSRGIVAHLIPLVADLMIVTASMALLDRERRRHGRPWLPAASLTVGIGSTVAMNVCAGLHDGAGGALVASLAPVALVLSLETLMWLIQSTSTGELPAIDGDGEPCPHGVAGTVDEAVLNAYLHTRDCLGEKPVQRQLATAFDVSRAKVAALVGSLNGTHPPEADTEPPDPTS